MHIRGHGENTNFETEMAFIQVVCDNQTLRRLTQFHLDNAFNEFSHQLRAAGIPQSMLPTVEISIPTHGSNDITNVNLAQLPSAERFFLQRNFGLEQHNQNGRNPIISESDDELTEEIVLEVT